MRNSERCAGGNKKRSQIKRPADVKLQEQLHTKREDAVVAASRTKAAAEARCSKKRDRKKREISGEGDLFFSAETFVFFPAENAKEDGFSRGKITPAGRERRGSYRWRSLLRE